jgi:virginiamycin B lyase
MPLPAGASTYVAPAALKLDGLGELSASADAIWTGTYLSIVGVDPVSGTFTGPFPAPNLNGLAAGGADVWASDFDGGLVRRFDAGTGHVVATISVDHPTNIAVTPDAVWVSLHRLGEVARIDPATNRVVATVTVGPQEHSGPSALTVAFGSVWVAIPNTWSVVRIDATTNKVLAKIQVPFNYASPGAGIAATTHAVWITPGGDEPTTVGRINPQTNKLVAEVDVRGFAQQPVAVGDNLWLATNAADPESADAEKTPGYLLELREDDTVGARFALGAGFWGIGATAAFGSIWVADVLHPRIVRVPLSSG